MKFFRVLCLFVCIWGAFSCSRKNQDHVVTSSSLDSSVELENFILDRYGLSQCKIDQDEIFKLLTKPVDLSASVLYVDKNGRYSLIIPDIVLENRATVINFVKNSDDSFEVERELSVNVDFISDEDGCVTVLNPYCDVEYAFYFQDGLIAAHTIKDIQNQGLTRGFCHQRKAERFSDCFERECKDFCDTFISAVAFHTNPSIPVLIAAMCSCKE